MEIKQNLIMPSDFDNVNIAYDIYTPSSDDNKKIILQIMHGMAEHKNRYVHLAKYLCEQGISVVVSSHRGHANSAEMQDYGYMGKDGLQKAKDDAHKLTLLIKKQYPDYKYCLMGHSMGSIIARLYIQTYLSDIDGLIICGSPAQNSLAPVAYNLASLLVKLQGDKHPSKFLDKLAFGSFNKRFEKRTKFDWLSIDVSNVDDYINDEGCGFLFTTQSFKDLMQALHVIYQPYPKPICNPSCPILFISGEADPCGNYGEGVKAAKNHLSGEGFNNTKLILYPNLRHEILNETTKNNVYADILSFIIN